MNRKFTCPILIVALSIFSLVDSGFKAQETDTVTELIVADGWQDVRANCTECHSSRLIVQNSGNKTVWESRIRWMQETQGMHDLNPDLEETILNYLAENYGQKEATRRAPLNQYLLPENPYEISI